MQPDHFLLVDIDGLRPDVFNNALRAGRLPNIARLLGGENMERGVQVPAVAPAPSITFASQASLFTGAHPARHGVPGNQFFDRFGRHSHGTPRHYAFDVGDSLAADDAVEVFAGGLAARCLQVPTAYAEFKSRGWRSVVGGHMYAQGADVWLRPSLVNLARFTKGGKRFGLSARDFDGAMLEKVLDELERNGLPNLLTVYFMGVDHESHAHGPQAQADYLEQLDGMLAELWSAVRAAAPEVHPVTAIFSDHGQIGVPSDDRHSLRLAFPFEREIGHLFDALGLDVHDFPGEDPNCDSVVASNGGMALVYLQNRQAQWADPPDFERDVLPVAQAFWEAHSSGKYAVELQDSLAGVLVRDVAVQGWEAPYRALQPDGSQVSLEQWFAGQPLELYVDPVHRLRNMTSPNSGDILLLSNYAAGFYFGAPQSGVHGGLNPGDSAATLVYGWPDVPETTWQPAREAIQNAIQARCHREDSRQPSTADMLTGLWALID